MSGLIYKKMSQVMAAIGPVKKDQKNQAQGFKFRGIDQFVNALHPALTEYGVFMAPKVVSYEQTLKEVTRSSGKAGIDKHVHLLVEYTFWAEDGSSVTVGPIAAEGLDSGDKATTKALSAGLKYALIQTFSVPTEDMVDSDAKSPTIGDAETEQTSSKPSFSKTKFETIPAVDVQPLKVSTEQVKDGGWKRPLGKTTPAPVAATSNGKAAQSWDEDC